MADTHSHDPQVHRHEHTHVTSICGMASRGSTWTPATTRAPRHRRQPCPRAGAGRLALRIGPVISGCVVVVPQGSGVLSL